MGLWSSAGAREVMTGGLHIREHNCGAYDSIRAAYVNVDWGRMLCNDDTGWLSEGRLLG